MNGPPNQSTDLLSCAEWLRQEGRASGDMDAEEADWCAKMNLCADEIERLHSTIKRSRSTVVAGWNAAIDAAEANLAADPSLDRALWIIRSMRKVA